MSRYARIIPLNADRGAFEAFEQRVEAAALDAHLAEVEDAERTPRLLCPSCGHDQDDHAPDHLPPYACTRLGCTCTRTPDHLLIEAPREDVA